MSVYGSTRSTSWGYTEGYRVGHVDIGEESENALDQK